MSMHHLGQFVQDVDTRPIEVDRPIEERYDDPALPTDAWERVIIEEDGDVLWAKPQACESRRAVR